MKHQHLLKNFYVVTMISNPVRYKSRYELYKRFEKMVLDAGAKLLTVEIAFGDRAHEITEAGNPWHLQLRTFNELWHKENAINLGIQRLPTDWEYVAWIDSDILFTRQDWLQETAHQLQHYHVVQMFSHAYDLGPNYEPIQEHKGFAYMYHQNYFYPPQGPGQDGYYCERKAFWHPGYAWAMRREAFDEVGGLVDFAVLGAADHHMALALIGQVGRSVPGKISPLYLDELKRWQARSEQFIKRDVGYVPGVINHWWHGKKKDRKYVERWDILTRNKFDPDDDLKRDAQGLYQLETAEERQIRLRDEIRHYMRQRNEDSIDLE